MSKLDEARDILDAIQVPAKQQNVMCCCVLLAMAGLKEDQCWVDATSNWIRIHDVIAFASDNYGITYAENSREPFVNKLCTILETLPLLRITEKQQTAPTIDIA